MDLLDCDYLVFLNGLAEDFKATVCFLLTSAFDYPRNIDNFSSKKIQECWGSKPRLPGKKQVCYLCVMQPSLELTVFIYFTL